jgi:hypothetical protein
MKIKNELQKIFRHKQSCKGQAENETVGKPKFFNNWENVRCVHVNTLNSCRSCNIKISLAGRRNKSNTKHHHSDDTEDRSNASTNKTFISCDYDGWPQICTKAKFTQFKHIDRWLT